MQKGDRRKKNGKIDVRIPDGVISISDKSCQIELCAVANIVRAAGGSLDPLDVVVVVVDRSFVSQSLKTRRRRRRRRRRLTTRRQSDFCVGSAEAKVRLQSPKFFFGNERCRSSRPARFRRWWRLLLRLLYFPFRSFQFPIIFFTLRLLRFSEKCFSLPLLPSVVVVAAAVAVTTCGNGTRRRRRRRRWW